MSLFNFSAGYHSPPRRPLIFPSQTSPFCTSPSQLQEVTLDQDVSLSYSIRSPNGTMRGRSVKEIEEQLAFLKKDNFNLKLRIYFLEERMGTNFNLDKENIVKKNIELMVDVESLKKELQEKHELLCQAVKAIELEDEEHKRLLNEKDENANKLMQENEQLKLQLMDAKYDFETCSHKSFVTTSTGEYPAYQPFNEMSINNNIQELQTKNKALQDELMSEKENSLAVQMLLDQKESTIKAMEAEINSLKTNASKPSPKNQKYDDVIKHYNELERQLRELNETSSNLKQENQELRRKQTNSQAEFEREKKKYEKLKASSEEQTHELQSKLESALNELKKSQDLVVSQSPIAQENTEYCDSLFLVSESAASPRFAPAHPNALQSNASPLNMNAFPSPVTSPCTNKTFTSIAELENRLEYVEKDRAQLKAHLVKLKAEQMKACKIIKTMIESRSKLGNEIKELRKHIGDLEKGETRRTISTACQSLAVFSDEETSTTEQNGGLIEQYKVLTDELEEKNKILMETLEEKNSQFKHIQTAYEDLVNTMKTKTTNLTSSDQEPETNYHNQIKQRDVEIERLNIELKKKNFNLQGLVNTELWEKNRQIEKLTLKHECKPIDDTELTKLRNDLTSKEAQLNVLKWKISELGIEIDNNMSEPPSSFEHHLQIELEKSEKLRFQANEACHALNIRLEELALFLDSLLKQKTVLGFLGIKENRRLRQIIDQSLDLSRTFTSFMLNPDQSLTQLSNITELLNDTNRLSIQPDNSSLVYDSHLKGDDQNIVETLRQQIINLKYELQLRDNELGKLNCPNSERSEISTDYVEKNAPKSILKSQYSQRANSESESWSEPDRNVSRERIGLYDMNICSPMSKQNDSTTEEEEEEETEHCISKKDLLNESRNTIIGLHQKVCELDAKLGAKEAEYVEAITINKQLQEIVEDYEIKLEEVNNQKLLTEMAYNDFKAEMEQSSTKKIENLEEREAQLVEQVACVGKEAEMAKVELEEARTKLNFLTDEVKNIEARLKHEYEQEMIVKMQLQKEENEEMMKQVENECVKLQVAIAELQEDCMTNYVKKTEVEARKNEAINLATIIQVLEEKIEDLNRENVDNVKRTEQHEERVNMLRNSLDNATLQYSEAVLEKTKIANEKATIEHELNMATMREIDASKRMNEVEAEVVQLRQNISCLRNEKSKLEVKISELEQSNAELHNRLVKIQAGNQDLAQTLPIAGGFANSITYRRQLSDQSGYNSEDILNYNRMMVVPNSSDERHEANSSPDLGIESDHGRFSSLEAQFNLPRPLLQTLELTESMSNLLDGENNKNAVATCDGDHCCEKTLMMAHENTDLKRKLLRTRRALEETVTQLTLANQRKKQVEKNICKQIHKTSQVLRKAKANLDSGSETDLYRK